jgi:hypothetical protein
MEILREERCFVSKTIAKGNLPEAARLLEVAHSFKT